MGFMVFALIAALCLQGEVAFSQQPQQQPSAYGQGQGMNYDWISPYYAAASKSWVDYAKKAQEATNQLYKQWDKTGAGDMIALGMSYAQMAAKEFQKNADTYSKMAQQAMASVPFF